MYYVISSEGDEFTSRSWIQCDRFATACVAGLGGCDWAHIMDGDAVVNTYTNRRTAPVNH